MIYLLICPERTLFGKILLGCVDSRFDMSNAISTVKEPRKFINTKILLNISALLIIQNLIALEYKLMPKVNFNDKIPKAVLSVRGRKTLTSFNFFV